MADPIKLSRRTMLLAPPALAACRGAPEVFRLAGITMGTTYSIVAVDHTRRLDQREVEIAISQALASVNAQMSNWDPASEISRFNAAQSTDRISVSPELAQLVLAANDVHSATGGQFDLTLGPLIELWGFGALGTTGQMPPPQAVERELAKSGQSVKLRAGPDHLQKTDPMARIYVSGIGKGHGVDRVADALASLGLKDYLVEIGGDIYASGYNPDGLAWQIGVERPDPTAFDIQQVVQATNFGMATSGDYRNYFEEDGVRYSHILDAQTGRPITHTTASTTVVAEDAMRADAWATAMLGLGRERGMEIAEAMDIAVLFVERGGNGSASRFNATESTRFSALKS